MPTRLYYVTPSRSLSGDLLIWHLTLIEIKKLIFFLLPVTIRITRNGIQTRHPKIQKYLLQKVFNISQQNALQKKKVVNLN